MAGLHRAAVRKKCMPWWRTLTLPVQNLRTWSLKCVQTTSDALVLFHFSRENDFGDRVFSNKFFWTSHRYHVFPQTVLPPNGPLFPQSIRTVIPGSEATWWLTQISTRLMDFTEMILLFIFSEQNHRLYQVAWMTWRMDLHRRYFNHRRNQICLHPVIYLLKVQWAILEKDSWLLSLIPRSSNADVGISWPGKGTQESTVPIFNVFWWPWMHP